MLADLCSAACNDALRKSRDLVLQDDGQAHGRGLKSQGWGMYWRFLSAEARWRVSSTRLHRLAAASGRDGAAAHVPFFCSATAEEKAQRLSSALVSVRSASSTCTICFNFTTRTRAASAPIPARLRLLLRLEEPNRPFGDGAHRRVQGALPPRPTRRAPRRFTGISPDDLKGLDLLLRLVGRAAREVILATNPNVEGAATHLAPYRYTWRSCSTAVGGASTRIARACLGGDLEYGRYVTLTRSPGVSPRDQLRKFSSTRAGPRSYGSVGDAGTSGDSARPFR